jgi:type IV pilus assembly protein PilQ
LSQNEETKSGTKVPILGGLPGIGRFFSSESNNVEQRNLIIFITAKTLNPDGSNYRDIIDPRMLKDMGVIPSDVPGYQLPQADLEALNRLEAIRQEARSSERVGEVRSQIEAFEKMKAEAAAEAATNARSN